MTNFKKLTAAGAVALFAQTGAALAGGPNNSAPAAAPIPTAAVASTTTGPITNSGNNSGVNLSGNTTALASGFHAQAVGVGVIGAVTNKTDNSGITYGANTFAGALASSSSAQAATAIGNLTTFDGNNLGINGFGSATAVVTPGTKGGFASAVTATGDVSNSGFNSGINFNFNTKAIAQRPAYNYAPSSNGYTPSGW